MLRCHVAPPSTLCLSLSVCEPCVSRPLMPCVCLFISLACVQAAGASASRVHPHKGSASEGGGDSR